MMFNEQQFRLEHRLDEVVMIDGITFKPRRYKVADDVTLRPVCYVCNEQFQPGQWYLRAHPTFNHEDIRSVLYFKNYFAHHESCTEKLQERIKATIESQ